MNVTLTYKSEIIFYHGPRSEVNRKPVFLFEVHLLDRIKLCLFVKMNFEIILELSSLIKQVSEVLHEHLWVLSPFVSCQNVYKADLTND